MTDASQQRPKPCAWAMRIPGCDGSADWAELGEQAPEPCQPAVAHPLYDQEALDAAVEQADARQNAAWRQMCEKMAQKIRNDAERYRYLRGRVPAEVLGQVKSAAGCWIDGEDEEGVLILLTGDDADAAIDAAMLAARGISEAECRSNRPWPQQEQR